MSTTAGLRSSLSAVHLELNGQGERLYSLADTRSSDQIVFISISQWPPVASPQILDCSYSLQRVRRLLSQSGAGAVKSPALASQVVVDVRDRKPGRQRRYVLRGAETSAPPQPTRLISAFAQREGNFASANFQAGAGPSQPL